MKTKNRMERIQEYNESMYSIYSFFSLQEALKSDYQTKYLVEGLISEGSLTCLFGDPGSLKTFSSIQLGICISEGLPFLGRQVRQGGVLYVDEENGKIRMGARIKMTAKGIGAKNGYFLTTCFPSINLLEDDMANSLKFTIRKLDLSLLIYDSFASLNSGFDENAVDGTQPIIKVFREVIEDTGCSILLIHHTNKGGDYRGSSAILAGVDTMVKVSVNGKTLHFKFRKARDFDSQDFYAQAKFIPGEFCLKSSINSHLENQMSAASRMITCLEDQDLTLEELIDLLPEFSKGTLRNKIHGLMRDGIVSRADDGGQGKKAIYRLVDIDELVKGESNE